MTLKELAHLVEQLPEPDFDWAGAEQVISTPDDGLALKDHVIELKQRMKKQSLAIHSLSLAYKAIRDLVLATEVSRISK